MTVNLSALGGAGQQFFDNNGNVLTGGKLWSYQAGTTTPQTTYTSASGATAHTNPIVLDSAGRVATGEIWVTAGQNYKFVLMTSANVTIATWDNITGINGTGIPSNANNVEYEPPFTGALTSGYTIEDKLAQTVSVKDFGAVGDGVTDDTAAINAAIAYAISGVGATQPGGNTILFPAGVYLVTEINLTISTDFFRSVRLVGEGRFASIIEPFSNGTVLLNMLGCNNAQIESLQIRSGATFIPQCAIFMARSTTSTNCNNNKFRDVFVIGNYSVATIVSNGSESSTWFGGRLENNYAPASHRCLWSGGGTLVGAAQNVTVVNGGTILNTNNPNTDNRMFGVEFYAPFNNANLIRLSTSVGYLFNGCTIVVGNTNNSKFVLYDLPTGQIINGPIQWTNSHFEGFGSNNVIHYFDIPDTGETTMNGFYSYSGNVVVNQGTAFIDFDKTAVNKKLTLLNSDVNRAHLYSDPATLPSYLNVLRNSSFEQGKGILTVFDFILRSRVVVDTFNGNDTRSLALPYEVASDALPTTGQWMQGTTIVREQPVVGQPIGWKVTVSGTLGTLNGGATVVAANVTSSNVVTVNSVTDMFIGCKLDIGGTLRYVRALSGTTVYLNNNITVSAGAAVAFSPPTIVAMANL